MENLYTKYINNRLSKRDLDDLKKDDFRKHTQEMGEAMHDEWMNSDEDYSTIPDEPISRIKSRLDNNIDSERHITIPIYYKVALWAAAVLLPLFVISSLYIYKDHTESVSDELTVVTHAGEKASVNLPDGTQVSLNSDSKLAYIPKVYNKDSRTVSFEGEGYFNVAKDKTRPFIVNARGLNVSVLGTKFNLNVRVKAESAELYLESGRVQFTSTISNKSVILHPSQKVTMNQLTGDMTVKTVTDDYSTAWRRNEMVFSHAPLETVIKCLENTYGVDFKLNYKSSAKDSFTGILVTNDLNSDLLVLETTNNIKITKIGNRLYSIKQN